MTTMQELQSDHQQERGDVDIHETLSLHELQPDQQERGEVAMEKLLTHRLESMKTYTFDETVRFEEMCLRVESIASEIIEQAGGHVYPDITRRVLEAYPRLGDLANEFPDAFEAFARPSLLPHRPIVLEIFNVYRLLAKGEISKRDALHKLASMQYNNDDDVMAHMYQLGVQLNSSP
tara:strand:- start:23 stop:553 length:531 start_codon:yes stop_codon:yes gene_type:complete